MKQSQLTKSDVERFVGCVEAYIDAYSIEFPGLVRSSFAEVELSPGANHQGSVPELVATYFPLVRRSLVMSHPALAELTCSLESLIPHLVWYKRPSNGEDSQFDESHFNAMIIGPSGAATVGDIMVGVSVMAPHTNYPTHSHKPAELYVVLSSGEWWQEERGWWEPGIGRFVHNRSGERHAMRSGDGPHLSIWLLFGQQDFVPGLAT
ncbi:dimethylsulfonioproprionate lyase family protein [Pseudomonas aeruginosa]|uniref:dimethylsulfonioproprionate lyase family protein n=1 Tax=Pseudomonas aeruginosa TaxID=287 RepID=UPI003BF28871